MRGWSSTVKEVAGHEFEARGRHSGRVRSGGDWTGGEDRTARGSLAVQFGSPEAAVRGGVSAASESVCASIAVMQGESRQRDGSMSFADRSISARRKLVVMCPLTMRHDADRSS